VKGNGTMSGPLSHISLSLAWWAREGASEVRKGRIVRERVRVRIGGALVGPASGEGILPVRF
jgi:hypothetical protein